MRTIPRLCIGLAVSAISLGSMAALAQDSYDYRRGVNFAGIRTFAFKETAPMAPDAYKTTTYDSPIQRERTLAAIAAQLADCGATISIRTCTSPRTGHIRWITRTTALTGGAVRTGGAGTTRGTTTPG